MFACVYMCVKCVFRPCVRVLTSFSVLLEATLNEFTKTENLKDVRLGYFKEWFDDSDPQVRRRGSCMCVCGGIHTSYFFPVC